MGLTYSTNSDGVKEAMELLKSIVNSKNGVDEKVFVGFNAFNDSQITPEFYCGGGFPEQHSKENSFDDRLVVAFLMFFLGEIFPKYGWVRTQFPK